MRKKIRPPRRPPPGRERRAGRQTEPGEVRWHERILMVLQASDPRLLDKETHKLHQRLVEKGASLRGPFPLPSIRGGAAGGPAGDTRIHRRLFDIRKPTEPIVTLLEKLPLAGSVEAQITVEEAAPEHEDPRPPVP